ncbi:spermidine/putrescine import ATP-binding protein PotA [Peptococcaceae bacterium CEB3]|nr:spermidine/putrescine import ATP-binding protein PotA [Peptococcaceae bacterium CEB3]
MGGFFIVTKISKSFGPHKVVDEVSFTLNAGEIVSILGPSGCGKTTLLRLLAGLELPDDGSIICDGHTFYQAETGVFLPPEKRELSLVFQDYALWPHLTVYQNVEMVLKYRRQNAPDRRKSTLPVRERVLEALDLLNIGSLAGRYPQQLSGGQQQRVAVARAIVARPKLVLLDEPFSALDRRLRLELRHELGTLLRRRHLTVLHVTHDQEEALTMSDKVIVMDGGKILQLDQPDKVYSCPVSAQVAEFIGKSNLIPVTVHNTGNAVAIEFPNGVTLVELDPHTFPPALSTHRGSARALALVRPEGIRIATGNKEVSPAPAAKGRTICLPGKVRNVEYLGDRYLITVEADTHGDLYCYSPHPYRAAEPLDLRIPLTALWLVPA